MNNIEKEDIPSFLLNEEEEDTEMESNMFYMNSMEENIPSLLKNEEFKSTFKKSEENQTVIDFLINNYSADINKIIDLEEISKKDIKKCLVIALQTELNLKGANLLVNGIFEGNTKTAYALYAGIITKGSEDKIVTIWKYILMENGYKFKNLNMDFDDECLEKTKHYQQSIKTAVSGIVGFNLLDSALLK